MLASWMGGTRRGRGRGDPPRGRDPDLRLPRHGGQDVQLHLAARPSNLRAAVRDADPARPTRSTRSTGPGPRRSSTPPGPRAGRSSPRSSRRTLLAAYGIPITETVVAPTADEAVAAADRIGYPVVVKLYSHTITHKTDVGGVQLNLEDAAAVRDAYEAIQASVTEQEGRRALRGRHRPADDQLDRLRADPRSSIDPQFGPVLLFGMGGQLVEVFRDRALGLPPLTTTLARRMMESTKIYTARSRASAGAAASTSTSSSSSSSASASSSSSSAGSARSTSTRCSHRPSG